MSTTSCSRTAFGPWEVGCGQAQDRPAIPDSVWADAHSRSPYGFSWAAMKRTLPQDVFDALVTDTSLGWEPREMLVVGEYIYRTCTKEEILMYQQAFEECWRVT